MAAPFLLDVLKGDADAHAALAPDTVSFPGVDYQAQGFFGYRRDRRGFDSLLQRTASTHHCLALPAIDIGSSAREGNMREKIHFLSSIVVTTVGALLMTAVPGNGSVNSDTQPRGIQEGSGLFRFIDTVQVSPDANYLTGAFARINYVPATDRFVVTFGGELTQPAGGCAGKVFAYKEYTAAMQGTGKTAVFACDIADAGSVVVDNTYYFAAMTRRDQSVGWHMLKIDAVSWTTLVDNFFRLVNYPQAGEGDPMIAFVNGQIDVSS